MDMHLPELTRALLEHEELDLAELASVPELIPESANAADLLDRVAETGSTFLVVVGEHGGLYGIVTAHDLAEAVLGDLGPAEMQGIADGEWRVSASIAIQELEAAIGAPEMRQARTHAYNTLAGFVMSQIGTIPRGGERFRWKGYGFAVRRVAGHRIREVDIRDLAKQVEKIRIARRMKESELEKAAGISRKTLYNFRKGATTLGLRNFIRLLRALGEAERLQRLFPEADSYSPGGFEWGDQK